MRTLVSGVSRGTEALVFRGGVPESQYAVMRAPFQEGELPGPVKYGYLNVGVVETGAPRAGRPHRLLPPPPPDGVRRAGRGGLPVPDGVPPRRAVLAGTVETAVNALWDAGPLVGDRVAVVGAGMVGCCVARLLAGIPGVEVTLVDTERPGGHRGRARRRVRRCPTRRRDDRDLVVHTSGTGAGLQLSLDLLGADGMVTDLCWYGDTPVELDLGGRFHSARLGVRASQVGEVAAARRGRRTRADRLRLALSLLDDPAYDALLTGESPFAELPEVMTRLASGSLPALCHTVTYEREA